MTNKTYIVQVKEIWIQDHIIGACSMGKAEEMIAEDMGYKLGNPRFHSIIGINENETEEYNGEY